MPKIKSAGNKIDIGCGTKKQKGFIGLDKISFPGVDYVLNIGVDRWPFEDGSVTEAYTSHFVEHLTAVERIHFCNELYRVLAKDGKCTLIVPHWSSSRAFGDPTHQWPPMGEFWFMYLAKKWRDENAPHTDADNWEQGYKCDFEVTWGYGMSPILLSRNAEFQQFAVNFYRESVYDIHASLTKK
jgi:hypothetical protein